MKPWMNIPVSPSPSREVKGQEQDVSCKMLPCQQGELFTSCRSEEKRPFVQSQINTSSSGDSAKALCCRAAGATGCL